MAARTQATLSHRTGCPTPARGMGALPVPLVHQILSLQTCGGRAWLCSRARRGLVLEVWHPEWCSRGCLQGAFASKCPSRGVRPGWACASPPTPDPRTPLKFSGVRCDLRRCLHTCTRARSSLADIGSPCFASSVCGLKAQPDTGQSTCGSVVGVLELLPGSWCFRGMGRPAEPSQGMFLGFAATRRAFSSLLQPLQHSPGSVQLADCLP